MCRGLSRRNKQDGYRISGKNDGHVLHKYKVIGMHVILRWKEIWMGERTDDNTLDPAMSSDINAGQ